MKKINLYIFIQIIKSCTLVFFIFVSIAWLLQISRLFSYMNNLNIGFTNIFFLSTFLLPNLMNVTLPFIVIFGLILTFIKLDKDRELIAMFSLGISINEIKKPLLFITLIIFIINLTLNLFISPYVYEKYKIKEFELRNLLDLNKINISNFIELDKNLILDFTKDEDQFKDIFISFNENGENIVYAKKGNITKIDNKFIFNLKNGFKLNFLKEELEKLEFKNYRIEFPVKVKNEYNNFDKNTLTIIDLFKDNDYTNITEKFFECILILSIIIFFYFFLIQKNNFNLGKILQFLIISILVLIFQNILKNTNLDLNMLIILNISNLIIIYLFIILDKFKIINK